MKKLSFLLLVLVTLSCQKKKSPEEYGKITNNPEFYHGTFEKLTDVIIHDIFSPPVASRIYLLTTLAGYEALVPGNPEYKSMAGKYKDFTAPPQPEAGKEYCYPLASIKAIFTIARKITFTVTKYDEFENGVYKQFKDAGVPEDVFERSVAYGEAVAGHVMEYSKKDNYAKTRGQRYTVKNEEGKWVPTPPQYADAMEPYWNTIRTAILDSANLFPAAPVIPYSKDKNSPFWKELMDLYNIGKNLTEEQKSTAWFWDDNAFVMNVQGHVMFANKKMTPGGHWLAITRTVSRQEKADLMKSAEAYLLVSAALYDGFISCWYEKYKSEKVRGETVINAEIDPKWMPFLQTPPFPEYTSGHSTISSASAEVLTALFGDRVAFTDSTEYKYGHGVKKFNSFREAAENCGISRIYGGIHYKSGCNEGLICGAKIGKYIILKTKNKEI